MCVYIYIYIHYVLFKTLRFFLLNHEYVKPAQVFFRWSNECPLFVAERCCHSVPVQAGGQDFDATMRVSFVLHRKPRGGGGAGGGGGGAMYIITIIVIVIMIIIMMILI